jgi:hypothetical protein
MKTKNKPECGVVLYHSTTKKNLKKILIEGIHPSAGEGWCKLGEKAGLIVTEEMKKACEENIFLSGNLETIERNAIEDMKIDTIAIVCVPQEKISVDDKPFKEWDIYRFTQPRYQSLSEIGEVKVRGAIPPENIIGCLDIKKYTVWQNRARYLVNKNCD